MSWNARTRVVLAGAIVAIVFTVYSARLIDLQVAKSNEYSRIAAQKNSIQQTIYARRGLILDRTGEILAENAPIRTAVADGSHIEDANALARVAAPYLQMDEGELAKKLRTDRKYVVIKREIPAETALKLSRELEAKRQRGLYFEHDSRRVYPNGPMLSHVIGFLDHNRRGIQGVELTLEEYLKGQDGFRHIERDRTGREIVVYRGQERSARDGMNVFLTIDMGLQSILEDELDNVAKQLKPETAVAALIDPKTGEVLAMASRPTFDPGEPGKSQPEQMKNRAIIDMVEPGSTFKIVGASGAFDEKLVNEHTLVNCEGGRFLYAGRTLRDHHSYGMLTVHDVLMKSSNIGSAKLALRLGDDRFYEYVKRFGFGERTGIELPGEIPGVVHPPSRWDKLTITRMPMGHAVAVTPLQMVMAMSVIANNGKLLAPHLVRKITDSAGKVVAEFSPTVVRQVVSPRTASIINTALKAVVSEKGTAIQARVAGYQVAGKTGTAEKVNPKGGYFDGKYVVSFVGYMPADDPAFVGIVMIDNAKVPSHLNYGGLVAAPIFSRIAERAARLLDLPPAPEPPPVTPEQVVSNEPRKQEARTR